MALTSSAQKAAAAIDQLAQSFADASAARGAATSGSSAAAEALADAIRRGQSPELVAALKRALGLR